MPPHVPSNNILKVLPVEILALIADVVRMTSWLSTYATNHSISQIKGTDFDTLFEVRLVCRAFNNLVEPLAFGSISFLGNIEAREVVIRRLRVLATEDHPYSRWAQTLKVEVSALFPAMQDLAFGRESVRAIKKALGDKRVLIGPAIESLQCLKSARCVC